MLHELNQLIASEDLSQEEAFVAFVPDLEQLRKTHTNAPLGLNRALLQLALPHAFQDVYAPYRQRMRGLIDVLRHRPSTRSGIHEIVAANLGIFGKHAQAREARRQIEIEEFLPRQITLFESRLNLFDTFTVEQPHPTPQASQLRLRVLEGSLQRLSNIRIIDQMTGGSIRYNGVLKVKDELTFEGSHGFLNSQPVSNVEGSLPLLEPGSNRFRFEADGVADAHAFLSFGRFDAASSHFDRCLFPKHQWPAMRFDQHYCDEASFAEAPSPAFGFDVEYFDELRFDKAKRPPTTDGPNPVLLSNDSLPWMRFDHPTGRFDETLLSEKYPLVELEVRSYDYTPGVFTLTIPWHLPGYTDQFAETEEHPRHLIQSLVDRVKASGTHAYIAYRQSFKEEQGLEDHLECIIHSKDEPKGYFSQEHPVEDKLEVDSRQGSTEVHALGDTLSLGGVFDYTSFDSLNAFER